jgi:hypothetical protein
MTRTADAAARAEIAHRISWRPKSACPAPVVLPAGVAAVDHGVAGREQLVQRGQDGGDEQSGATGLGVWDL